MAKSSTILAINDWTAVAQNAVGESATQDISTYAFVDLYLQAFLDTTTAHLGTEFIFQISPQTSGDEDWYDLPRFTDLIGTAITITITNNPAAAGTTTFTSGTVAAGWAVNELTSRWAAIKDGTLANSELMLQTGYTLNTSIVVQDGSTNEHALNSVIYSIAISRPPYRLPITANRVRLFVNNNYDNGGSAMNYKLTGIGTTL